MTEFSCVSWNIHRGRGNDGVVDPDRTRKVLVSEVLGPGTDALILQEADEETPPHGGILDISRIERETGLCCVHTEPTHRWGEASHGFLGVIVFLHPALEVEDVALLDLPGQCHRGAVVVDAAKGGRKLRLIATHLSLSQALRVAQMRTIGQHVFRRGARPAILCGDLNEWRPWGGLALSPRVLGAHFRGPAPATFPIRRPFLPLDRVLATPPFRVTEARVLDGRGIRMASDHRPLAARIAITGG
ncbi:endonuclease/exonuclease/phosphatase family protein [Roseibacterium sp. SDUM158017]|uniref:endonuclease/exonuclease/phosphatase family protein n=1 Tax=Roseicyclus salinarum TaxID=3036773 RepID=UPI0024157152|nr:endonuclease/exonuclease/phosphatase family protein [Roseibacterium sp. SDUM158017]MDG4647781.1 endonuclease/exonuclease/phosphatase family protein [Roseibacterium sp. SDUM158017]